jgi:hypothetical protein
MLLERMVLLNGFYTQIFSQDHLAIFFAKKKRKDITMQYFMVPYNTNFF